MMFAHLFPYKLLLPPRMYCVTLEDSVVEVKSSSKWMVRLKPVSGSNYQTLIGKFRHSELMSGSVDPSVFFRCVWFRGKKSKWCRI